MKSLRLIVLLVFLSISSACDKEHSCKCTDDQTGEIISIAIYELSKSDATSACNNANAEAGVTCVLNQN